MNKLDKKASVHLQQRTQRSNSLMIDIHLLDLRKVALGMCLIAQTCIAEGKHEETVDAVLLVEVAIPDL